MSSGAEPSNDLGGCLLARKLAKEFFDVLNLECSLLEIVLRDVILHGEGRDCTSAQLGEDLSHEFLVGTEGVRASILPGVSVSYAQLRGKASRPAAAGGEPTDAARFWPRCHEATRCG